MGSAPRATAADHLRAAGGGVDVFVDKQVLDHRNVAASDPVDDNGCARSASNAQGMPTPFAHAPTPQEEISLESAARLAAYQWPAWCATLAKFQKKSLRKAIWQLLNTFIPYFVLWYLMILTVQRGYSYVLTLALALLASAFLARVFIFFHDCVHGSFFASERANTIVGYVCGILVFTPLDDWRSSHFLHHETFANLDARGYGDISLMTVAEYRRATPRRRASYRLYRNAIILFGLGPIYHFFLNQRFPTWNTGRAEHRSVLITNLGIVAMALLATWAIGWKTYLLIQIPVLWLAGMAGIWLFYVQHQFEGVYWARNDRWDPLRAAFDGSSFYQLPAVLRWFTGSIGYHFVHHLQYGIPNYQLKACYDAIPELQRKPPLTLRKSLASARLKLWDEDLQKLVGFPR
jgi:acyl-lipid omega-6 desaturase (Delta-12 desaturase)